MAVAIGAVGVFAVAAVFGLWALFGSVRTPTKPPATVSLSERTTDEEALATTEPSETFVVPTPSYATPSLSVALGPLEPSIADSPVDPATLKTTSAPPSRATQPSRPVVSNLSLECSRQGRRVRATLTFVTTARVPVTLTAGARTESTTADGDVKLTLSGDLPNGLPGGCSALVNGQAVGPVPAR